MFSINNQKMFVICGKTWKKTNKQQYLLLLQYCYNCYVSHIFVIHWNQNLRLYRRDHNDGRVQMVRKQGGKSTLCIADKTTPPCMYLPPMLPPLHDVLYIWWYNWYHRCSSACIIYHWGSLKCLLHNTVEALWGDCHTVCSTTSTEALKKQ